MEGLGGRPEVGIRGREARTKLKIPSKLVHKFSQILRFFSW